MFSLSSLRRTASRLAGLATLVGVLAVPVGVSPVRAESDPGGVTAGLHIKPLSDGAVQIDPDSITSSSPDITVAVDSTGSLTDLAVALSSTGAVTVDAAPQALGSDSSAVLTFDGTAPTGRGTITATLTGVDAEGDQQAISNTVWVDSVDGTTVVSASGTQSLDLQVIDLRESAGLITPEEADVASQQAIGGTDIDVQVSSGEALCGVVCVTGTVQWTDSAGGLHPVRKATVEVREKNVTAGTDSIIVSVTTTATGSFQAPLPNNTDPDVGDLPGRDVLVRVFAAGPGFTLVRQVSPGVFATQFMESTVQPDVATGSNLAFPFTAGQVAQNETSFSLQNAMVIAGEYVETVRPGMPFAPIEVVFPAPGGGSFFDGTRLFVDALDRWDWDVMLHEYGHYLASVLGIENNPGGPHSGSQNLADNAGRNKDSGTRLAWGEGWPTYFAVSSLKEMGTAALNIPNIGDDIYQDTEDQIVTDNLETGGTLGEDNEVTVMSALWDLYDPASDGIDNIALGTGTIWTTLDNGDPKTLSDAYKLFAPGGATAPFDSVNCVFSQMNVAPRLAGSTSIPVTSGTASPTLTWARGNGGLNGFNKSFVVEYRSFDNASLLHTSGPINTLTYTAPAGAWTTVLAARETINVSVIGTQTDAPVSGPYRSCATKFTQIPVVVATNDALTVAAGAAGGSVLANDTYNGAAATSATVMLTPGTSPNPALHIAPSGTVSADAGIAAGTYAYPYTICAFSSPATCASATATVQVTGGTPIVTSIAPKRFADTRSVGVTLDGQFQAAGIRPAGSEYRVKFGGRGDVPANAAAVVVNITAVQADGIGFITSHACLTPRPTASSLNYTAGVNLGNEVVVQLNSAGEACFYTSAGAHLTADVVGYMGAGSAFAPVAPARLLETRAGPGLVTIDGVSQGAGRTTSGSTTKVRITGRANVPAGVEAVVVNVTAIAPNTTGFVTVHPCLPTLPTAASLNYVAGVNRANELIAPIDANGDICLFTSSDIHLAVDVVGSIPKLGNYHSVAPARLLDTRPAGTTIDGLSQAIGKRAAGQQYTLTVGGRAGVPIGASSAVIYVTAVNPEGIGFVTVHPCEPTLPTASSLNHVDGVNGGNEIVVKLNASGQVCLFTSAATNLTVDVAGYST